MGLQLKILLALLAGVITLSLLRASHLQLPAALLISVTVTVVTIISSALDFAKKWLETWKLWLDARKLGREAKEFERVNQERDRIVKPATDSEIAAYGSPVIERTLSVWSRVQEEQEKLEPVKFIWELREEEMPEDEEGRSSAPGRPL